MKYAQDFIQSSWAIENGFKFIKISKELLNKLLKGEIKTLEELKNIKFNEKQNEFSEKYTIFYIEIYDNEIDKYITTIDSIFINN
ncbi:hypothetical protein [Flavobacterium aquidurense]|uniref:hypothetical protein n=1 Tax=Flavobacterium aquidurense TaxID=362413 RepID=UPI00286B1B41|nr:hypothetical protein [Flavobacterium aquidurense]